MQQQRKIKVLQAIRQGQVGGGETHILNLVGSMDKTVFEPVVLSFTDGQMIDELNRTHIQNHVIPSNKAFDIKKWKEVRSFLESEAIDIVHVHGTRANSNVYWAAKALGLPIIYTIHGWSFHDDQSWLVKNVRVFFERWITSKVNCNISVSASNQATGHKYISHFQSLVINNGINLKVFNSQNSFKNIRAELNIPQDKCVIGSIARMTLQKDPLTLIRAFKSVLEKNDNVMLLMVGDGELKEEAMQLASDLGISDSVVFEKFRSDVPDILNAINIFCLPSLWEGLPIGLLEAMAMSKAVIASDVDGSKEIVQNKVNGLLIAPQQTESLAKAISVLAGDQNIRRKYGEAARETVAENFDIEKMTRQVENVYLDMLKSKLRA